VFRLAFGSCNRQTLPQPLWPRIAARAPDAFAWLGDIVYADHAIFAKLRVPGTLPEVAAAYAVQAAQPAYAAFVAGSNATVLGVWDDHDLGHNDGGGSVPEAYRRASKGFLLDFLKEPQGTARRERAGGVHTSYFLLPSSGGSGAGSQRARVLSADRASLGAPLPAPPRGPHARLILLDVRYSRDDYAERPWAPAGAPGASAQQDMLGPEQWQWLEEQLQQQGGGGGGDGGGAAFTIITAGLQVLPFGDAPVTEGWVRHPASLARLLALLALHAQGNGRFLLLSGDVHFGELSVLPGTPAAPAPLYELTSSGMTHSWGGLLKGSVSWLLMSSALRARVGAPPRGSAPGDAVLACASNLPWLPPLCLFTERNWGEVELHFGAALGNNSSAAAAAAVATLRLFGAESSEARVTARVQGGAAAAAAAEVAHGTAGAAPEALPEAVLRACAHPPSPPLPGVSDACRRVLGPLADAAALPSAATLALHAAVAALLLGSALAALAMAPLLWCGASGRAGAALAARTGAPPLLAHAAVGAALAVYCACAGGVTWSFLEQLLV
jgi:alkaline phosphatase D